MNPQTLQSVVETGTAGLALSRSLALSALAFAERLSAVHAEFARSSLEQAGDLAPLGSTVADWQNLAARQNAAMREAAERAGAWLRGVCEAGSEAQATAAETFSSHLAEIGDRVGAMVDRFAEGGPAGSNATADALRSALAGNRIAYDNIVGITRRMAEANAAVVNGAVQAMGASAPARKAARKAA